MNIEYKRKKAAQEKKVNYLFIIACIFMCTFIFFPFMPHRVAFGMMAYACLLMFAVKYFRSTLALSRIECLYIFTLIYSFFVSIFNYQGASWTNEGSSEMMWFVLAFILYILLSRTKHYSNYMITTMFIFSLIFMVATYLQFIGFAPLTRFISSYLNKSKESLSNYNAAYSWGSFYGLASTNFESCFFISICCSVLCARCYKAKNIINPIILYAICMGSIMLSGKRSILLANILIFVICSFVVKKIPLTKKNIFKIIIAIGAFIVCIYYIDSKTSIFSLFYRKTQLSSSLLNGREGIYAQLLKNINDEVHTFFLGHGLGSTYLLQSQGAHNIYIQLLYEVGIMGFLLFSYFFISNLKKSYRLMKHSVEIKNETIAVSCFYMQLIFLIYGLFGNPLFYNSSLLIYFIVLAIGKKMEKEICYENRDTYI